MENSSAEESDVSDSDIPTTRRRSMPDCRLEK